MKSEISSKNLQDKSDGFLPLLGMIPSIIGGIGKLSTGQGLDFPLDEEGNEKGGILPALGALLPMALKALPLILAGAGAAASTCSRCIILNIFWNICIIYFCFFFEYSIYFMNISFNTT